MSETSGHIHRVLIEKGYDISYSSVCKYIQRRNEAKTRKPKEAFIKHQYDWNILSNQGNKKINQENITYKQLLITLQIEDKMVYFHVIIYNFVPDIFFFDAAEAGLRYIACELRLRGSLVYFEPESDADKKKFLKAVEVSDIVKFSHEKVNDLSFVEQYKDKLFIRTMGAEELEFNLCGLGLVKVASVANDNVVDWEGAGDWTTSQFITSLCERDILSISQMTIDILRKCLKIACTTASRSVSHLGSKGMIDTHPDK